MWRPASCLRRCCSDNSGGAITVNTLALQAGTLDVASGASLNFVNPPNGITDIPHGAGLIFAGTFTTGGTSGARATQGSAVRLVTLPDRRTGQRAPRGGTATDFGS